MGEFYGFDEAANDRPDETGTADEAGSAHDSIYGNLTTSNDGT